MRTLVFEPTDRKYEVSYWALQNGPTPLRGATERRTFADMLAKLEAIGSMIPPVDGQGRPRALIKNELVLYETLQGGTVELTEPEFDLLKRHVTGTLDWENFPKAWNRDGLACEEWLNASKVNEPAPAA